MWANLIPCLPSSKWYLVEQKQCACVESAYYPCMTYTQNSAQGDEIYQAYVFLYMPRKCDGPLIMNIDIRPYIFTFTLKYLIPQYLFVLIIVLTSHL